MNIHSVNEKRFCATLYFLALFMACPGIGQSVDERLSIDAKINGRAVRLAMDTGSAIPLVILKPSANKLSLKTLKDNNNAIVATLKLEVFGQIWEQAHALIIDSPPFPDVDGLIGWPALKGKIWKVHWQSQKLLEIPTVPQAIDSWDIFSIDQNVPVCAFNITDNNDRLIYIDTGNHASLALSPARWEQWLTDEPNLPTTLQSGFSPAAGGFYATALRWSKAFKLHRLRMPGVMVSKSVFKWARLDAVIGLKALAHFEVIIDLKNDKIYMKNRTNHFSNISYNRFGAAFLPDRLDSKRLVGQVIKNSPAYNVGIRDGDILLKINDFNMTKWKTDPEIWKHRFWEAKAGTKYTISIERDGKFKTINIVLEDIFNILD